MQQGFNESDYKNIEEIRLFLEENNIEYNTEYNNFCLNYGNLEGKRSYQIEYVPALMYPIAYPKYNIEGVDKDYFYKLSKEAEDNNSFILWKNITATKLKFN